MPQFNSPLGAIPLKASADVNPCRFIAFTAENVGTQCAADADAVGVSAEFTEREPNDIIATTPWGVHATTGKPISYYVPGQICNLELGGTVSATNLIKASTAGVGIAVTGTAYYVLARAITSGVSGEKIPVLLLSSYYKA